MLYDIYIEYLQIHLKKIAFAVMILFLCLASFDGSSQQYDLLIKNGHVIDPKNRIDSVLDIAIAKGKIAKVGKNILVRKPQNWLMQLVYLSHQV